MGFDNVNLRTAGGVAIVGVAGCLTSATGCEALEKVLHRLLATGSRRIVLDLAESSMPAVAHSGPGSEYFAG